MQGVAAPDFSDPDLGGIEELLGLFLTADREYRTDGEVLDAVVAMDRIRTLAEAALAAAVDELDGRALCGADGMRSSQAWLKSRTEMAPGHASSVVLLARDLRDSSAVRDAYRHGVLGTAKVKLLLAARVGVEPVFVEQVDQLIQVLRTLTVDESKKFLLRWREIAQGSMASPSDDDGPVPDPEDHNGLHLSPTLGGRVKLDGDLDAVSGRALINAVEAEIAEWFRTGASSVDDGESPAHRRARAFCAVVARGALAGEKQGQARPSVTLNIDLAELLGLTIDDPAEVFDRRCDLDDGTPISRRSAERLLCDADVTAIITKTGLDGVVEPLGAAHQKRYPTRSERRALARRDGGCVFPGCDMGVDRSDAHHLDHWHLYGRTELSRLVMLCRFHHHQVHEGGYRLDRSDDGYIGVTRPDGTRLPRAGPGHQPREPDQLDETLDLVGTGPPIQSAEAPSRPRTRFRTLAQRHSEAERNRAWWITWAGDHGITFIPNQPRRLSDRRAS